MATEKISMEQASSYMVLVLVSRKDEVDISLTTLAAMKEVIGRTQNQSLILRALPVFHDIHYETKQMGIDEIKDLTEMLTDGIAQQWIDGIMSIKLPIIGNMKLEGDA